MRLSRLTLALLSLVLLHVSAAHAQQSPLTVEQIMQDSDKWVGSWPSSPMWSEDGEYLYFYWNPSGLFPSDSLFKVSRTAGNVVKVSPSERRNLPPFFTGWHHGEGLYARNFSVKVYEHQGDIFLYNRARGSSLRVTSTQAHESNPRFGSDGASVVYRQGINLYRTDQFGQTLQLTDLRTGQAPGERPAPNAQDTFLQDQQDHLFDTLRRRKKARERREEAVQRDEKARSGLSTFYVGDKTVRQLKIDPSERFVTFVLTERSEEPTPTQVPDFVTESGYTEPLEARPKVGAPLDEHALYVQDLERDTTYQVDLHQLPGAYDVPAYRQPSSPESDSSETLRALFVHSTYWNQDSRHAVVEVWSRDHKDRWITRLDPADGTLSVLDRQHDDAWIGGPGINGYGVNHTAGWLSDGRHFFFQSEKTGYSHLYVVDVVSGEKQQLTDGDFEVFAPRLGQDGQFWYFESSEGSPFERHFYKMALDGSKRVRLTTMPGFNHAVLNPNGIIMGVLHSYTNRLPEIYLQPPGGSPSQITDSPSSDWLSYDWRDPEIITFEASDGVPVPAHIFRPEKPNGAAVLFVHGAGYLQNVHKGWTHYFREYMFHNLLTDLGYTVMNVDYRGSAGYGRDWRTAIYRHMGGRDLQDFVDASRFLGRRHGIDPERVFIYGGSYGGFITLMALFTEAEHFGGGAALRSVTDWAHYNHGYTSNILNTPAEDSLAFARSSPIYFAEGLEDPLLIAHGMIDRNVHFQDVVRLAQRLIELGKEDWEMAVYPLEGHGFTEPESWTDEYRRILKLIKLSVGPKEAALEEVPLLQKD